MQPPPPPHGYDVQLPNFDDMMFQLFDDYVAQRNLNPAVLPDIFDPNNAQEVAMILESMIRHQNNENQERQPTEEEKERFFNSVVPLIRIYIVRRRILSPHGRHERLQLNNDSALQLQQFTRTHTPNIKSERINRSLSMGNGLTDALTTRFFTGDKMSKEWGPSISQRVKGHLYRTHNTPWNQFDDLPISRESALGLVPVLKPNRRSQDDYNIVVNMQRTCLMLLRAHDYVNQRTADATFFLRVPWDDDDSNRLVELKLVWDHVEKVGGPVVFDEEPGRLDWKPRNKLELRALLKLRIPFHLTPEVAKNMLRITDNWRDYQDSRILDFRCNPVGPDSYQSQELPGDRMCCMTRSPGVTDTLTGNTFQIFARLVDLFPPQMVRRIGKFGNTKRSTVSHAYTFVGPPCAWYEDDVKPEGVDALTHSLFGSHDTMMRKGAKYYVLALGLFILKISETRLVGFEQMQKEIDIGVREVERVLTMYWGEAWRVKLRHVVIEPSDFSMPDTTDTDFRGSGLGGNKKKLKVSRKSKSKSKKRNKTYKRK